jgi:hypothetical protein
VAAIQHAGARKLLDIIASAVTHDELPSYKTAAKLLGRLPPEKHSRAVAQMCDLLDAAAALAGVPLLALVRVRNSKGKINPKAWKKSLKHRNAILERSKSHRFTAADFKAISLALRRLEGLGNRAAWHYARQQPGFVEPFRNPNRFDFEISHDAINDIGTQHQNGPRSPGLRTLRARSLLPVSIPLRMEGWIAYSGISCPGARHAPQSRWSCSWRP